MIAGTEIDIHISLGRHFLLFGGKSILPFFVRMIFSEKPSIFSDFPKYAVPIYALFRSISRMVDKCHFRLFLGDLIPFISSVRAISLILMCSEAYKK